MAGIRQASEALSLTYTDMPFFQTWFWTWPTDPEKSARGNTLHVSLELAEEKHLVAECGSNTFVSE